MNDSSNKPNNTPTPFAQLYRVVWRWHFYAGLFVVLFIVLRNACNSIRKIPLLKNI